MFAEQFAILIKKLRIRNLQRPGKLRRITLARVNLIALGMHLK